MSEKKDSEEEKPEDDKPGFRINLPGKSWIRGDGSHLSQLMPILKWVLAVGTAAHLAIRLLQDWRG